MMGIYWHGFLHAFTLMVYYGFLGTVVIGILFPIGLPFFIYTIYAYISKIISKVYNTILDENLNHNHRGRFKIVTINNLVNGLKALNLRLFWVATFMIISILYFTNGNSKMLYIVAIITVFLAIPTLLFLCCIICVCFEPLRAFKAPSYLEVPSCIEVY